MSLPRNLMYDNAISASFAKNFVTVLNCNNTNNHSTGSTAIISVPCMNNQVLSWNDSVLKMKLKLTAVGAASCHLDRSGIAGCIQRIRIFAAGSTLIYDLDNYGNLVTQLTSFQESHDTLQGKLAVLQGTESDLRGKTIDVGAGASVDVNFAFPLMTCLGMSDRYFPCYALAGSGPLRIEIQFVSSALKFLNSDQADVTAQFNEVQLCANYVELSDSGMNLVKEASGPRTDFVCQAYTNYVFNAKINAAGSQLSMPIPAKFSSLKALYVTQRAQADAAGAAEHFPYDSTNFSLSQYTASIGSKVIPADPASTSSVPSQLAELERALGSVTNSMSQSSYRIAQIQQAGRQAGQDARSNCFMVGIETESYSSAPMGSTYSGLNTTQDDIYFRPVYPAQDEVDIRLDAYAAYDQLVSIENGVVSVNF